MARPSTIERLPADILAQLQALLRDPRVSQLEATARINAILEEDGHPDRVSKSAVNRYSLRMEEVGTRLRQTREVAEMWIGRLGSEPAGDVGKLLNEMIRGLAFDATMHLSESDEPVPPKLLRELSVAVERLERAARENTRHEDELRKRATEEAAERAAGAAKKRGLSAEAVDAIRREILGVPG